MTGGRTIVLTAPLTEMIDHAGYFIQMGVASLPSWMEWMLDRKYPEWRDVQRFDDGSAGRAPAGIRILETVLQREFGEDEVAVCYPQNLDRFVGDRTRVVAISTHNPLGVTFAAGVYTSMFGSSKRPINAAYAQRLFERLDGDPRRSSFRILLGGSGAWQIRETGTARELGIDCVIDGRSESAGTLALFRRAVNGEPLPEVADVNHPPLADDILFPEKPTTFGVVEMTTGCGRRCKFCMPDLNPQIDLPKERILNAVRANVVGGNKQISLATEDMFIWGQVKTDVPFFFPNREALVDLYADVARFPGVDQIVLSHSTMAPAVVDPVLIEQLTETLIGKSPLHIPSVSRHPDKKVLTPLIDLETGSPRLAKQLMPSKAVPFPIEDWPSVVVRGLEILNKNHWYPMMNFSGALPEHWMQRAGKLYEPRPLRLKTRAELLASIRPGFWKYLREDTGDVPVGPDLRQLPPKPPAPTPALPSTPP